MKKLSVYSLGYMIRDHLYDDDFPRSEVGGWLLRIGSFVAVSFVAAWMMVVGVDPERLSNNVTQSMVIPPQGYVSIEGDDMVVSLASEYPARSTIRLVLLVDTQRLSLSPEQLITTVDDIRWIETRPGRMEVILQHDMPLLRGQELLRIQDAVGQGESYVSIASITVNNDALSFSYKYSQSHSNDDNIQSFDYKSIKL